MSEIIIHGSEKSIETASYFLEDIIDPNAVNGSPTIKYTDRNTFGGFDVVFNIKLKNQNPINFHLAVNTDKNDNVRGIVGSF